MLTTQLCFVEVPLQRIELGLYGTAAPRSVATFLALARGELAAPCAEADESGTYRAAAGARRIEREAHGWRFLFC